jgi:hypothetical protein
MRAVRACTRLRDSVHIECGSTTVTPPSIVIGAAAALVQALGLVGWPVAVPDTRVGHGVRGS